MPEVFVSSIDASSTDNQWFSNKKIIFVGDAHVRGLADHFIGGCGFRTPVVVHCRCLRFLLKADTYPIT